MNVYNNLPITVLYNNLDLKEVVEQVEEKINRNYDLASVKIDSIVELRKEIEEFEHFYRYHVPTFRSISAPLDTDKNFEKHKDEITYIQDLITKALKQETTLNSISNSGAENAIEICDKIIIKLGRLNELEHVNLLSQIGTYKYEHEKAIQSNINALHFLRTLALPNSRYQSNVRKAIERADRFLEDVTLKIYAATNLTNQSQTTSGNESSSVYNSCTSNTINTETTATTSSSTSGVHLINSRSQSEVLNKTNNNNEQKPIQRTDINLKFPVAPSETLENLNLKNTINNKANIKENGNKNIEENENFRNIGDNTIVKYSDSKCSISPSSNSILSNNVVGSNSISEHVPYLPVEKLAYNTDSEVETSYGHGVGNRRDFQYTSIYVVHHDKQKNDC